MTSAVQRLHLFEYEAATDTGEYFTREEGCVLDEEEVARLLLGTPDPSEVIEGADQSDALVAMRGVMIGLACAALIWGLVAAIFRLA